MNQYNSGSIFSKNFSSSFRGYDKSQVDNYLQTLSSEFKILETKINNLEDKLSEQKIENEKFKNVESSLIKTLKVAEDTGKNIIDNAKSDSQGILDDARNELSKIKEEYDNVRLLRDNTIQDINDLKEKINSGLDTIGQEANFDEISESIDAVEENITDSEKEEVHEKREGESLDDNLDENVMELELDDKENGSSEDVEEEDKINEEEKLPETQEDDIYELTTESEEEPEENLESMQNDSNDTKDLFSEEKNEDKINEENKLPETQEDDIYELTTETENESSSDETEEIFNESKSTKEENLESTQNDSNKTSDLFSEEKNEEDNNKEELSADDIFGGQDNHDEVDLPEEENEKDILESDNEDIDSELESQDEKNESEKKRSDDIQRSFFDTFDEN